MQFNLKCDANQFVIGYLLTFAYSEGYLYVLKSLSLIPIVGVLISKLENQISFYINIFLSPFVFRVRRNFISHSCHKKFVSEKYRFGALLT